MDPELLIAALALPWVLLALFAAFSDALVGFVDEWLLSSLDEGAEKETLDPPGKLILISGFFGIVTASLIALVALFQPEILNVSSKSLGLAVLAGCIEVLWLIPYFHAIHRSGALNATPLLQTVPIFAGIIGILLYGEQPGWIEIAGILLLIGGGLALNYVPQTRRFDLKTVLLMLSASLIIALGLFVFKDAAISGTVPAAILGNGIGMFLVSLAIWFVYRPYRLQFNQFVSTLRFRTLAVQGSNEALYTMSAVAGQYAVVLGPSVMVVSAFNAFHPLFTLLIAGGLSLCGVQVYKERLAGRGLLTKSLGVILITSGALLVI